MLGAQKILGICCTPSMVGMRDPLPEHATTVEVQYFFPIKVLGLRSSILPHTQERKVMFEEQN